MFSVVVPGWVMAIPLVVGFVLGVFLTLKFANPRHWNVCLVMILVGMCLYYLGISRFEIHDEPPANLVPFSTSGNSAAV